MIFRGTHTNRSGPSSGQSETTSDHPGTIGENYFAAAFNFAASNAGLPARRAGTGIGRESGPPSPRSFAGARFGLGRYP
jgi:hypothetical protein